MDTWFQCAVFAFCVLLVSVPVGAMFTIVIALMISDIRNPPYED